MIGKLSVLAAMLVVLAVMWGLRVLVGRTGRVGGPEIIVWLALLVTAEVFTVRWLKGRTLPT
jgi:hypothetical protein